MSKIIECIPNFSEGQNQDTINAIAEAIRKVEHVKLLNIDSNISANRTVYTFAGEPEAVANAAFEAIKVASELIDMSKHKGTHPRIGATDVCPLSPVSDITMEEVVEIAAKLSKRIGEELQIPVYNYEYSSKAAHRKRLEQIRQGEYEGLEAKMQQPEWKPDFGPDKFNPKTGATILGARNYLIAYNINLESKDIRIAKKIAGQIRESGTMVKLDGGNYRVPGRFKGLKSIGWYIEEFDKVQVSTNITDFHTICMAEVFEYVKKLAEQLKTKVTGSELIGLIPSQALKEAGEYYCRKAKMSDSEIANMTEDQLYSKAVKLMNLNDVKPFEIENRLLEKLL